MQYNKGKNNPAYIDNRTNKIHYCIDCKTTKISLTNYFCGKQRCRKCASLKRKGISINLGKNNGNYKNGERSKLNPKFCIDCKKIIFAKSLRCKSCAKKGKGISHTEISKKKIAQSHLGMKCPLKTIKKLKNSLHRHHIDLDRNNNKEENILVLSNSKHGLIHRFGYHYLVETGQILDYIKWFQQKYEAK